MVKLLILVWYYKGGVTSIQLDMPSLSACQQTKQSYVSSLLEETKARQAKALCLSLPT